MELGIAKDQGHGCRSGDSQRHGSLQGAPRASGFGGLRQPGERAHIAGDILAQQRILEPGAKRGIGPYRSQSGT
jgi:hypothetical protein